MPVENIMMPDGPGASRVPSGHAPAPSRPSSAASTGRLVARYMGLLRRFFWIPILAGGLGLGGAHLFAKRQPRIYQTQSKIIFHQGPQNVFGKNIEHVDLLDPGSRWQFQQFWNTQSEVLRSRTFGEKVVRRAGLLSREGFVPTQAGGEALSEEARMKRAVARVRAIVKVDLAKNSRVAVVTARTSDPELAALLATEFARAYVDYAREFQSGGLNQMIRWFDTYVSTKRKELNDAQGALHKFKSDKGILSVSYESRQNLTGANMTSINERYNTVRHKLADEQALLAQINTMEKRKEDMRALAELINSESLRAAIEREGRLEEKLAHLRGLDYGEKWREVKAQSEELKTVRGHIKAEIERIRSGLRNRIGRLERERDRLKRELDDIRAEALRLDALGLKYNQLRDNAENLKQLYESVLKRSEELDINSMYDANTIRVLEEAPQPGGPVSPNVPLLLLVGLALGVGLGVGIIVLLDMLDNTIKSEDDITRATDRPILGVLPRIEAAVLKGLSDLPTATIDRLTHLAPKSSFAEGIKALRTNLMFMSPDNPPRLLLVTSPGPGEGKTVASTNMAIAMAQSGLRTLLIDADMRRPRVHKAMGVENMEGFSSLLTGELKLAEAARPTEIENLDLLTCGPIPPNPSELLYTERFRALIEELRGAYDRVIFDSPPLGAVADALVVSHKVDAVVLLVMLGKTRRELLGRAIEQLTTVGAPFMGCVMNNLSAATAGYGYSYYYYRSPYEEDAPEEGGDRPARIAS